MSASESQAKPPHAPPVQARIAMLRAEVEASTVPVRQSALHFEMGALIESQLKNDAMAVKEYLTAYNLAPSFRPPLFALIRIFERRRSFKNLDRLYGAEAKTATSDQAKASALVDRGVLQEDQLSQPADAQKLFEEALETDRDLIAAIALERAARHASDQTVITRTLRARAERTDDPTLQSVLLTELAWELLSEGNEEAAFETVRQAISLPAGRYRALEQLARMAVSRGRSADLIQSLEGRAELAGATVRGQDHGQTSGAFSVRRFSDQARAADEAISLLYQSARLRIRHHGDAAGAARDLAQAIALRPEDVLLRQEHMLACELAGDLDGAAADAQHLIEQGVSGRLAAALHFRLAEQAQARQDAETTRAALGAAMDADPNSAAAQALLDDMLLDLGLHDERATRLAAQGSEGEPEVRARALWRAAQIASDHLNDFPRARTLYKQAIGLSEDKLPILRELHASALQHRAQETTRDAIRGLLEQSLDDEERGALLHELHELLRHVLSDTPAADALLTEALSDPAAFRWAPDVARLHAASAGDHAQLAIAHRATANRASDNQEAAAHLCAAGRALLRGGDEAGGMRLLRDALERVPGHRYAVALLEEILRSRGEADEVVALLRQAAEQSQGEQAAELNLLLAAAAAEATGDAKLAAETFEEAADRDPTSLAPLWSLRRLAERTNDADLLLRAREGLSERELAAGEPGRATFELGEHYDLGAGKSELAEGPLRAAIESASVGTEASAALVLLPGPRVDIAGRMEALARLAEGAREDARVELLRALGLEAQFAEEPDRVWSITNALLEADPGDRWGCWARMLLGAGDPSQSAARAEGWASLAAATDDAEAAAELTLHALRSKLVTHGAEAADDAFLLAQEIAATAPEALATAVALDETLSPGDDPESRVEALTARAMHAGREGTLPVQGALGRAQLAAGRAGEALNTLKGLLARDKTDLAAWEALRVAAREEGQWTDVVRACDQLAGVATGDLRAQLQEEAAAVLMDELGKDGEAETRLRAALDFDAGRTIAFGRLHDLLAERNDSAALEELVGNRLEVIDDSDELVKLFYEQARLLRGQGDRSGALSALENLLMLEEEHVGGLALSVEIHVSLEQWGEAVDTLRQLASSDVPPAQKRIALMGAADFLDKRLGESEEAITELRKVVDLGLADPALYVRISDIAQRAELFGVAIEALEEAANAAEGAARASHLRRAGWLAEDKSRDEVLAMRLYRRALQDAPTDLDSGEALSRLIADPVERQQLSDGFEASVRTDLETDFTNEDALRKLRRAAAWRGDADLELRALDALVSLGLATPDEEDERIGMRSGMLELPRGGLAEASLSLLRAPGDARPARDLNALLLEPLTEMDRLEPSAFGAGRGQSVSPKKPSEVRDAVQQIAMAFDVPPGDFFHGGTDATLIAVMPGKKLKTVWVVGASTRAPLNARQRFTVGQLAMAMHDRTVSLIRRSPKEAATTLYAAAAAVDVTLDGGGARSGLEELKAVLAKRMPRRVRKALPEVLRALPEAGAELEGFCRGAARTTLRAGLLAAGDLGVSLEAVLGPQPTLSDIGASATARDLILFWISPQVTQIRRELGLVK